MPSRDVALSAQTGPSEPPRASERRPVSLHAHLPPRRQGRPRPRIRGFAMWRAFPVSTARPDSPESQPCSGRRSAPSRCWIVDARAVERGGDLPADRRSERLPAGPAPWRHGDRRAGGARRRDDQPGLDRDGGPPTEPGLAFRRLSGRALDVGRDHVTATVNTLVLAYWAPRLRSCSSSAPPTVGAAVNLEVVAKEVVATLVGRSG
jgi:YibE/F-like protein